ncbi:hypothetical protein CYMTET_42707 [Cymbomonas tetramitiformis]|uniref:Uncharacterized protein n=1 Tax=Cymbomonas tetramitiformis TaxID=36881 RepID=A0AAE0F1D9_9CHLO|nr:hypothetical protein CYMTET_42707 [Cymbomonas tetramitiformis]
MFADALMKTSTTLLFGLFYLVVWWWALKFKEGAWIFSLVEWLTRAFVIGALWILERKLPFFPVYALSGNVKQPSEYHQSCVYVSTDVSTAATDPRSRALHDPTGLVAQDRTFPSFEISQRRPSEPSHSIAPGAVFGGATTPLSSVRGEGRSPYQKLIRQPPTPSSSIDSSPPNSIDKLAVRGRVSVQRVHIDICQATTCSRAGSAAVFLEIEDMVRTGRDHNPLLPDIQVGWTPCLANCGHAPNVTVTLQPRRGASTAEEEHRHHDSQILFRRVESVAACHKVIRHARGMLCEKITSRCDTSRGSGGETEGPGLCAQLRFKGLTALTLERPREAVPLLKRALDFLRMPGAHGMDVGLGFEQGRLRMLLAEAFFEAKEWDQGLAMVRMAGRQLPDTFARPMELEGRLLERMGHYGEALAAYEEALQRDSLLSHGETVQRSTQTKGGQNVLAVLVPSLPRARRRRMEKRMVALQELGIS